MNIAALLRSLMLIEKVLGMAMPAGMSLLSILETGLKDLEKYQVSKLGTTVSENTVQQPGGHTTT